MYIVRFVRQGSQPNEDYYYHNPLEAIGHMKLFVKDDSGIYKKIQLIFCEETEIIVTELVF